MSQQNDAQANPAARQARKAKGLLETAMLPSQLKI